MGTTRAAVLTVSDGVADGTREDGSGDAAVEMLREAGFEVVDRRVVPDESAEIESALRELAGDERAGRVDRRYRLRAARRDAGGDPRRDRPGRPGALGADARHRARPHADGGAVSGRGGCGGGDVDPEPPRQPRRGPGVARGRAAGGPARRRAPGRIDGAHPTGHREEQPRSWRRGCAAGPVGRGQGRARDRFAPVRRRELDVDRAGRRGPRDPGLRGVRRGRRRGRPRGAAAGRTGGAHVPSRRGRRGGLPRAARRRVSSRRGLRDRRGSVPEGGDGATGPPGRRARAPGGTPRSPRTSRRSDPSRMPTCGPTTRSCSPTTTPPASRTC